MITSGYVPEDPQDVLSPSNVVRTLDSLKKRFRLTIIDSAPYLAVADTSLLAPYVDGVLLVIRYGVVTQSEAIRTKIRLDAAPSRVLGRYSTISTPPLATNIIRTRANMRWKGSVMP